MRIRQAILIGSTMLGAWLGMQAVHELGHVLGAWVTGGKVAEVVLHPLTISRTDLSRNPHPLIVVWAGPLIGVVVPLLLWTVAAQVRLSIAFVLRFFAGFCLVANGLYIAFGSLDRVGDCGVMLAQGSEPWQLWLFGLATVPWGMWLWHNQGEHFGFGQAQGQVDHRAAYGALLACMLLIALALAVDGK